MPQGWTPVEENNAASPWTPVAEGEDTNALAREKLRNTVAAYPESFKQSPEAYRARGEKPPSAAMGREFALGALGTYLPESEHPFRDIGAAETAAVRAHPIKETAVRALGSAVPAVGIGQWLGGMGKQVATGLGEALPVLSKYTPAAAMGAGVTPEENERLAHGLGTVAGVGSQFAIPEMAERGGAALRSGIENVRRVSPFTKLEPERQFIQATGRGSKLKPEIIQRGAPALAAELKENPLPKPTKAEPGLVHEEFYQRAKAAGDRTWNERVQPALEKNATEPAERGQPMAREMLKAVEPNDKLRAQLYPGSDLEGVPRVAEFSGWLKQLNAELNPFFRMNAHDRYLAETTNPRIANSLRARDYIANRLFDVLEDKGEHFIPEARKEFGAIAEIRNQIEKRVPTARQARAEMSPWALGHGLGLGAISAASGHPLGLLGAAAYPLAEWALRTRGLPDAQLYRAAQRLGEVPPVTPNLPNAWRVPPERWLPAAGESNAREIVTPTRGGVLPAAPMREEAYPVRPGVTRKGTSLLAPEQINLGPSSLAAGAERGAQGVLNMNRTPAVAQAPPPVAPAAKIEGVAPKPQVSGPPPVKSPSGPMQPVPEAKAPPVPYPGKLFPGLKPPKGIFTLDLRNARFDPETFQFKRDVGKGGVSDKMKDVNEWEVHAGGVISIWRDAEGRDNIVNGHHRANRALELGEYDQPVRFIDAKTPEQAMVKGAVINIRQGQGTAVDAAKIFRMAPEGAEETARRIGIKDAKIQEATALAKLSEPIWDRVWRGELSEKIGRMIGEAVDLPENQEAALKMIEERGRDMSDDEIRYALRFAKGGLATETTTDLFGTQEISKSLALEKAKLAGLIDKQLGSERSIFSAAGRGAGAIESRGVGKISAEQAAKVAKNAAQSREIFDKLADKAGPVGDAVERAAKKLAAGEKIDAVRNELYKEVIGEISKIIP